MKADIKARWVEALRSGDYVQGRGVLRSANQYCCLGVLCDLAAKEGVVEWTGEAYQDPNDRLDASRVELPVVVCAWAGLSYQTDPGIASSEWDDYISASTLNDAGRTFTALADLIEENL